MPFSEFLKSSIDKAGDKGRQFKDWGNRPNPPVWVTIAVGIGIIVLIRLVVTAL
jgi:hypothetical protein